MSHYDDVLAELKEEGEKLANQYVLELYTILRDEEKLQPEDCRARIEHDCLDLWSRATIRKYLPPEAKDFKKQAAGKIGAENKNKKNKKALQLLVANENGARTNLAEDDSFSQKEEESRTFHNELNQQLSSRILSPELIEATKIITNKDQRIEELEKDRKELLEKQQQQHHHLTARNSALLFLPYKLAMQISDNITGAAAATSATTAIAGFDIEYDEEQVTAIYAVKINTLSSPTNNPSQASHPSQLIEQQTTLKAGESIDHTLTPAATALEDIVAITNTIHRIHPHSDVFKCDNCKQRGDKWYMQKHLCNGLS